MSPRVGQFYWPKGGSKLLAIDIGAKHVGIIQSLLTTCRLHNVDPYTYLVDVLQRVALHPARDVIELTPRVWKERFADNPLRSDLEHAH